MIRTFTGGELVVATHNKGKLDEIRHMFGGKIGKLSSAADYGLESPEETGTTFIENALLKARYVATATGKIALADDSGLCIDILGGDPGVYSADWAGENRDFGMAIQKILKAMAGAKNRTAHFVSVLALCWPDGHCETVEGIAHGKITLAPQGTGGHGYDPIFTPDGHDVTYAEMTHEQKNAISHRSISFHKMMKKCFP